MTWQSSVRVCLIASSSLCTNNLFGLWFHTVSCPLTLPAQLGVISGADKCFCWQLWIDSVDHQVSQCIQHSKCYKKNKSVFPWVYFGFFAAKQALKNYGHLLLIFIVQLLPFKVCYWLCLENSDTSANWGTEWPS